MGALPFCEVEWRGTTGRASSCCIPDVEQAPSAQPTKGLILFCTNHQNADDGVFVQTTETNAGWRMHVIHKSAGQLYDRNLQYDVFAFRAIKTIIGTVC
jgi:hypothetical protein